MKEKIKRFFASIAAIILAVGMMGANVTPVMAEDNGSITITPATGAADGQEYKVYKVFQGTGNGTNISYKLLDGKSTSDEAWTNNSMSTYFSVDGAGNVSATTAATEENNNTTLNQAAVTAIAGYVRDASLTATTATKSGSNYVASGLADGYYYITTTTGTVVTIDSVNGQNNKTVQDKNSQPGINKTITAVEDNAGSIDTNGKNAVAQVGKKVSFQADITVGKGAKGYVFEDTMPKTLDLDTNSIEVWAVATSSENGGTKLTATTNYTVDTSSLSTNQKWTVTFTDDTVKDKYTESGYHIYVLYKATVNSSALHTDAAQNSATISWGDPDHKSTSEPSTTDTYNATITVNKTFAGLDENASLPEGQKAEFVLTNADGNYYKISDSNVVTWEDTTEGATVRSITKNNGSGEFAGLPDGTYTLKEITAPDGYNKAADVTFTVNGATVTGFNSTTELTGTVTGTNLNQATTINNTQGSELPSTGGIGTTIFYVIGGVVVAGAVILLVLRRRRRA